MPSAHHNVREAASSDPQPQNDQRTPKLRSRNVCVGCIVWLPLKLSHEDPVACNRQGCRCRGAALEVKGYDHPVVVLKIQQRANPGEHGDLVCTVACATSFDDCLLPEYIERKLRRPYYQASIPILNSASLSKDTDPEIAKHLVLEKGALRKQSYVRLQHTYQVPVSMLTQYSRRHCKAYKMRLSKESYAMLMEEFGLVPEAFEETDRLCKMEREARPALSTAVRRTPNLTYISSVAESSQRLNYSQIYQHSPAYVPQQTLPTYSYGATSFTPTPQYVPPSYPETHPYSISPEPSDADSSSSSWKYLLGVFFVGAIVWWRFSR